MDANKSTNDDEPAPPGVSPAAISTSLKTQIGNTSKPLSKGVENAKKRLRAFSIQKKTTPISPIVPKPVSTGSTTVLIGKLTSVKTTPKVEDEKEEKKKPPKPPKPGCQRKSLQESYPNVQRRTLKEIEDMKRKMELVELGIPLGLIGPTPSNEKAMPTKAMPPIKTFLDEAQVDEIIREAKKCRDEGRQFKFDYNKLLPDYDNPFQRKKEDEKEQKSERKRDGKSISKYDYRRHPGHRKDDRDKYKEKDREKSRDRYTNKDEKKEPKSDSERNDDKETDVNLKDFLVCDSWSLENDEKTNSCSPKTDDKTDCKSPDKIETESKEEKETEKIQFKISKDPSQLLKESLNQKADLLNENILNSPSNKLRKIEKLQPVMDSFKFEIDENEDEVLDIFDEDSNIEKYSQVKKPKNSSSYDSPLLDSISYIQDKTADASMDGMTDESFLESVINEIRQDENMCVETSQDKRLVEYDESPSKEDLEISLGKSMQQRSRVSVTPELDERMKERTKQRNKTENEKKGKQTSYYSESKGQLSQRSDYSDGRKSVESGYKTSDTMESNKYVENFRMSVEKDLDEALDKSMMTKSTVESLETWSFVLKICQPLLFRHDKNKCYRETRTAPKLWYTENPKTCTCVKDRAIVYEELEMMKMGLVDRVYGCDQLPDTPSVNARAWYPRSSACLVEGRVQPVASEWEADDSQHDDRESRSMTPERNDAIVLDREYQRFMEAVWPEVAETKAETSRSTTPVQQDFRQKKKEEEKESEDKKSKKIKLSSEGWSQESEIEEEPDKGKKIKSKEKTRKRKRSSSSVSTISDSDDESSKKKRKMLKKKALKKAKSKEAKRRRIGKKLLKKLKEKQKQKKKAEKEQMQDDELENERKKELRKARKRKQQKLKKKNQKRKKKESSSSSDSSSSSSFDSDSDDSRAKRRKRKLEKKREKRRKSSNSQSEDLFDVNILNNIKTERLTDDEKGKKLLEFSPRIHHKPREIINVKELQNDFVGNNIHIKKEVEEPPVQKEVEVLKEVEVRKEVEVQNEVLNEAEVQNEAEILKEVEEDNVEEKSVEEEDESVNLDNMVVSPVPADPPTPVVAEEKTEFKEPQDVVTTGAPIAVMDESNMSQSSSQESVCSVKETPTYEKDESHLRPSSQNSNYSFNDVMASQSGLYQKGIESIVGQQKYVEAYDEAGNYEMYEQLAMAYQSDVATQASAGEEGAGGGAGGPQRIETVVRARARGEIKCDWRADHPPAAPPANRPSRWGLKPNEVNIVLTGGEQSLPPQPVYRIQSLANRTEVAADYDEAYMDMYGASDRLQYGDCFADPATVDSVANMAMQTMVNMASMSNLATIQTNMMDIKQEPLPKSSPMVPASAEAVNPKIQSTLDARIDQALRETVLGKVAKDVTETKEDQRGVPEKGILLTNGTVEAGRGVKRVSFADGYKPGQDSDVEEPPIKKRRARRAGCAWPCPAAHPDHVPLWDALPPPPPPPGDPPAPRRPPRPPRLCRPFAFRADTGPLSNFMPPEPPPGVISF